MTSYIARLSEVISLDVLDIYHLSSGLGKIGMSEPIVDEDLLILVNFIASKTDLSLTTMYRISSTSGVLPVP